jgi:hypothetical protein
MDVEKTVLTSHLFLKILCIFLNPKRSYYCSVVGIHLVLLTFFIFVAFHFFSYNEGNDLGHFLSA